MGTGIAARLALAGILTELVETNAKRRYGTGFRLRFGKHLLGHAVSLGYISLDAAISAANRLHIVETPGDALRDVDLVIEAVPDDVQAKHLVYRKIVERTTRPDTIVASTTAAVPIAALSPGSPDPTRFLGWHWAYPSLAVPYTEVIPGPETSSSVVDWTIRIAQRLGKSPTVVHDGRKPGFGLNRIWYAMMDEARAITAEGSATEDVVDRQFETSQLWPKGPFRVDREESDVVGTSPWPMCTVASLDVIVSPSEFRPPVERARGERIA
jgi:3-hydroxyacyl-CoA dehydrogenase